MVTATATSTTPPTRCPHRRATCGPREGLRSKSSRRETDHFDPPPIYATASRGSGTLGAGCRELRSNGNATPCCGPCSSALGPPHRADRGDRAQVLDQDPVDGESALA